MLRKIYSFIFLVFLLTNAQSQIDIRGGGQSSGKPCYQKSMDRMNQRFIEFDCGKVLGVINCNDKLEYEEQSNIFYIESTGLKFTGTCETCHRNGLLERRITFVDGRENGIDTTYYSSGCPMVIRQHDMGLETGTWRFYHDSTNQLAWIKNYYRGVKHGIHLNLDDKGDTTMVETYMNDLLNGEKRVYFTQNRLSKLMFYKDGQLNGPYVTYNLAGEKISELNYKMGKKDGVLSYYFDDGTLLRTENWNNGVKNGEFKTLYYNGTLQKLENFKKGVREGLYEERYSNQQLKRRIIFKKGERIEEHRFDEDGTETYTFGAQPYSGNEDDALPTYGKGKKKDKKNK